MLRSKKIFQLTCGKNSNLLIASGYEMNANPVPLRTTLEISSKFRLCARLPRMPKIVMPAIRLVNVSSVVTINTSLLWIKIKSGDKMSTTECIGGHTIWLNE